MSGSSIPFRDAVDVWVRVALQSFGGPAGQIAVMHRIVVEEKGWVDEGRFLHALNFCMLLPGPEAQQLATYLGWMLHGVRGGLVAGSLFVLPGFLSILALSYVYVIFGGSVVVTGLFFGLKAAVLALVLQAVARIGGKVLRHPLAWGIAAASFVAIFAVRVPFPAVVAAAAMVGLLADRWLPGALVAVGHGDDHHATAEALAAPSLSRALKVSAVGLGLWLGPLLAMGLALGPDHVFVLEGVFFSQAAVVTFGGAYAVLAYVAQQAVDRFGWLAPGEMLDGLGMAESTPGPLIQVVQFVGFMGAYRHPGGLDPLVAATLGAMWTTWVTFVPCFLWIFLGAPYVEALRGNRRVGAALSAITAAVVGVILQLGVWFGLHVLFGVVEEGPLGLPLPRVATVDPVAGVLAVGAWVALRRGVTSWKVLLVCAALGIVARWSL